MKLLNVDKNSKTVKGQKKGYLTGILYLSPATLSGINICPMTKLAGCEKLCLNYTGHSAMSKNNSTFAALDGTLIPDNRQQHGRLNRTQFFHSDREGFLNQLKNEINKLIHKGKRDNLIPVIRLNGTSDIRWENIKFNDGETLFEKFPNITFYDYTKLNNRKNIPDNYYLLWSYSEASKKYAAMRPENMNWVVVFKDSNFPETFLGRKVIDGDENDLRFLDPDNIVVGVKAKGPAKKDTSGFVIRLEN